MEGCIDRLLTLSDEEIFIELGESLRPKGFAIDLRNTDQIIEDAKLWLEQNINNLRESVCTNVEIKKYLADMKYLTVHELVAAIADLISGFVTGLTPFLIAIIIVRNGLNLFCNNIALGK